MTTISRNLRPLVLLAGAYLAVGCGHDAPSQAPQRISPVTAHVAPVERVTEAATQEVYGLVQPTRQAVVSGRVTGPVVSILVAAGTRVEKGSPLLEIQPEVSAGQMGQAQGALAQASAALALAERNHQRYLALHAEKAASELELDLSLMQLDQARGAVEQARGALQSASAVAAEAVVRAPFTARVVDTLVEVGDLAAPGRPLVRVESLAGREIWLDVRSVDLPRVSVGQVLPVTLDSRPELGVLEGRVAEIVPSANPATQSFTVKVGLGEVDVPSGLSGRARVPGKAVERLLVPSSAVHRRGGLDLVVVRGPDGAARTRAVTVGATMGTDRVEVLSGLEAEELVVVDLPAPVADGTPVEVSP